MDVRAEIAKQVDKLPPTMQERVLQYVSSLCASAPIGENGATLCRFSGSLDNASASEMIQAIEEECERIDACGW